MSREGVLKCFAIGTADGLLLMAYAAVQIFWCGALHSGWPLEPSFSRGSTAILITEAFLLTGLGMGELLDS